MAEQRGGDEKDLQFGGSGETIDGLRVDEDEYVQLSHFHESILCDEDAGDSDSCKGLFSIENFENMDFGSGGETTDDDVTNVCGKVLDGSDGHGEGIRIRPRPGFVDESASAHGVAPRRLRLQYVLQSGVVDRLENQDFGQDTNRLDYFRVTAFDVHGNDDLSGIATYGGGGVGNVQVPVGVSSGNDSGAGDHGSRDQGVVVGPMLEQERRSVGASGGRRPRRVRVGISPNNDRRGGGGVRNRQLRVRTSSNSGNGGGDGDDGRRSRGVVAGSSLKHERVSAGVGGGDKPRRVRVGFSPKNDGGGGIRNQQLPVGISFSDGSDGGDSGRRGGGVDVGLRLERKRDSGGDRLEQVRVGIPLTNDGGDGEEEEEKGGLVVLGWWEQWWVAVSLWKIV